MKPQVKVFSRDSPCTKLDLWNCFYTARGFVSVPVVDAQAQIGANAPRVMEREGRLFREERKGIEYYTLTAEGGNWLSEGFQRYLKNHPSHVSQAKYLPVSWGYAAKPVRLRRTR